MTVQGENPTGTDGFEIGAKALRKETGEVAVMIDTRDALDVTPAADGVEWSGSVDSWKDTMS